MTHLAGGLMGTAMLELLDNQRFARGVRPDRAQLDRVMVRRMKSELDPRWDGTPRFPARVPQPLEVPYTQEERAVHRALTRYSALRAGAGGGDGEGADVATKFVLTLLKKRLFSSPPAFARTLGQHLRSMTSSRQQRAIRPTVQVLRRSIDAIEEEYGDEESFEAATGDTKAEVLLGWLDDVVRPAGPDGERRWGDERVIVFTEYRDTQRWLQERLVARGLGGERLALLYGGMDADAREDVKARFQAEPSLDPVRILLATDAASEGIDLQRHCHRLVHYEIPWNPNRLEQRNGRIDRHGQTAPEVLVFHFVGAGWQQAEPGSLEGDLQFLWTVVEKVERIREDLGSVGPVIAEQVEEAMLGRRGRTAGAALHTGAALHRGDRRRPHGRDPRRPRSGRAPRAGVRCVGGLLTRDAAATFASLGRRSLLPDRFPLQEVPLRFAAALESRRATRDAAAGRGGPHRDGCCSSVVPARRAAAPHLAAPGAHRLPRGTDRVQYRDRGLPEPERGDNA